VPIASGSPSIPPAETLIHDALIITVDPEDRILDPGDLLVEDGRIAYVGPTTPIARVHSSARSTGGGSSSYRAGQRAHLHVRDPASRAPAIMRMSARRGISVRASEAE
jgi:cytosine/adenosine deaminase-related metal-dependent hydrolase